MKEVNEEAEEYKEEGTLHQRKVEEDMADAEEEAHEVNDMELEA